MSKKKKEIERSLEYIINMSLGQASRDSPFEITAKVFQLCQNFCESVGGEEFKQKFNADSYFETSSQSGLGIEEFFNYVAKSMI